MFAAVDSCFGLIGPLQHGTANKQAQTPTENTKQSRSLTLVGCGWNIEHN